MNDALAAGEAFFALGVTFFSTLALLLFNPRSSGVRWYAFFQSSILVWLFAQGAGFATGDWGTWRPWMSGAVHLSPGLFLAFAVMQTSRRLPLALAAIAVGVALLPVDQRSMTSRHAEGLLMAWTVGGWVLATALFVRMMRGEKHGTAGERRLARTLLLGIVLVMPVGILASILSRANAGLYIMPLAMVWIQVLLFVGVARLRFYDIEVRAVRTGELAASAAEQERLAVVGELSASLAHEIRNPLTGVRSLAQRLAEEEIPDDKRRRYASVILEEVGRVERLVANLLGIARRAPRVRDADARTPLAPLFEDLALLVAGRAEKAGVRVAAEARGLTAASAREPLAQALLNLLLNAVAHTPAGGAVSLAAREAEGGVEIAVRDSGPGVPREQRERVWEPFHTGGDGTGLGLAVVRRVAREEGWTAEVGDAPGGGAEFRILLPRAPVDAVRGAPPAAARIAGLLALLLLCAVPADAQSADAARVAAARERATALRDSARVPGLSVAVAAGGRVVWAEGFGWADVEGRVPAAPSTIYQLGSVSKPLTAAGLMRLAERGAIDLDAPVQRYVPAFPDRGAPVTLRRLAAHLGGIRHYEPRDFARPAPSDATVTDRLAIFADDALVSPPGTRHAYSSYGYVLLSAAMEAAAGRDFLSLMRAEVFAPLGMQSTGPLPFEDARRAENYGAPRGDGTWPRSAADARSGMWAAASLWSSAPDLAVFGAALMRPGFLRPESVQAMWTPQRTAAGEDTGYGLGWRVGRDTAGRRIVHHGGRTPDLRAFLLLYPGEDVAIAVLANGPADFAEEAVGCIAEPFLRASER